MKSADFVKYQNVLYCDNIHSACKNADLIVIHTEWDEFKSLDFNKIVGNKKFKIYDMRNLYQPNKMRKLGITYYSIGR